MDADLSVGLVTFGVGADVEVDATMGAVGFQVSLVRDAAFQWNHSSASGFRSSSSGLICTGVHARAGIGGCFGIVGTTSWICVLALLLSER